MGDYHPRPVAVSGGSAGIDAECDDLRATGCLLSGLAAQVGGDAAALHAHLLDPALITAGTLDPQGALDFEASLARALDGPGGLTWTAVTCGVLAARLIAAAEAYLLEDRVLAPLLDDAEALARLPGAAMTGLLAAGRADPLRHPAAALGAAADGMLTSDPELGNLAALVRRLPGPGQLSAAISLADGSARVRDAGAESGRAARNPPRSVADLVRGLARRDADRGGAIDVRILSRPGGRRAVVVDIPGTKSWLPFYNRDVASVSSDIRALDGVPGAYEHGVLQAMSLAGVRPDDDVMLVGHSLGGMVAVDAAVHAAQRGRFHVTHVVTAGAPIGGLVGRLPNSVEVLALENRGDVVPRLDGRSNPALRNVTTVEVRHEFGTVGDDHSLEGAYLPGALDVDASNDPSIRHFRQSASAFFDATKAETRMFAITRQYP